MKHGVSARRIFLIAGVIAAVCLLFVAALPAKQFLHRMTRDVLVAPVVDGTFEHYGKPEAGLEVRRALLRSQDNSSCADLPVVAVSNETGAFHVVAVYRPYFRLPSKHSVVATCFMYQGSRVDSFMSFPMLPHQRYSFMRISCYFPPPVKYTYPEDRNCIVLDFRLLGL